MLPKHFYFAFSQKITAQISHSGCYLRALCILSFWPIILFLFLLDDDSRDNNHKNDSNHDNNSGSIHVFSPFKISMLWGTIISYFPFFFLTIAPVPTTATAAIATTITAGFIILLLSPEIVLFAIYMRYTKSRLAFSQTS